MFSTDWTATRTVEWIGIDERFKHDRCEILEIGVFEGQTSKWLLDNIIKHHPESFLTGVDPFLKFDDHEFLPEVFKAKAKSIYDTPQSELRVETSDQFFKGIQSEISRPFLNIAYIDGDHSTQQCLSDLTAAWHYIIVGGYLIMDDWMNEYPQEKPGNNPQEAMKIFLSMTNNFCVEWSGKHTIGLRKIRE